MWEDHSSSRHTKGTRAPLGVKGAGQHDAKFLLETGLTLEQSVGRMEVIQVALVVAIPYGHENLLSLRSSRSV